MADTAWIDLPAEPQWFATARLFAASIARHYGCDEPAIDDLKLAMSEACNNAATTSGKSTQPARIMATRSTSDIKFLIRGGGHPALQRGLSPDADDPTTWELAGVLGAELIRALFPDATVSPNESGGLDLEISVALGGV